VCGRSASIASTAPASFRAASWSVTSGNDLVNWLPVLVDKAGLALQTLGPGCGDRLAAWTFTAGTVAAGCLPVEGSPAVRHHSANLRRCGACGPACGWARVGPACVLDCSGLRALPCALPLAGWNASSTSSSGICLVLRVASWAHDDGERLGQYACKAVSRGESVRGCTMLRRPLRRAVGVGSGSAAIMAL
jgi:hypothetical protein